MLRMIERHTGRTLYNIPGSTGWQPVPRQSNYGTVIVVVTQVVGWPQRSRQCLMSYVPDSPLTLVWMV